MTAKATRRYNLRATDEQAALIDAAMRLGNERSVTDYILGSAVMVAEQRLMARNDFRLNSRQYQKFLDALERPVQDKPRLRRLMTEPSALEEAERRSG
jgi:uncharacterized protein (DUF1778 family)